MNAALGFIAHLYRVAYFFANPMAARATLLVDSPTFTGYEETV